MMTRDDVLKAGGVDLHMYFQSVKNAINHCKSENYPCEVTVNQCVEHNDSFPNIKRIFRDSGQADVFGNDSMKSVVQNQVNLFIYECLEEIEAYLLQQNYYYIYTIVTTVKNTQGFECRYPVRCFVRPTLTYYRQECKND